MGLFVYVAPLNLNSILRLVLIFNNAPLSLNNILRTGLFYIALFNQKNILRKGLFFLYGTSQTE